MQIRPATEDDLAAIVRLVSEFRGQAVDADTVRRDFYVHFVNSNDRVVLLADDGNVLGMVLLTLIYKLDRCECRLDEVFVSEAARGKGVGRQLLAACEAWAWQHEVDEIGFTSRPSREAANALYQKAGFTLRQTNVYQKKRENS